MAREVMRHSDEIREKMLYLKNEGKSNLEISEAVGLTHDQVKWFFSNYYAALRKNNPEQYPKRKPGRQRKPEPTRKELEKIIKEQKKLLKLYEDAV
ncbi:MAG: hypothetical protein FWF10_03310 [Clostridiales bacterium]|nr:hypothetical protein [Clostridiales bacterium]